MYINENQIIRNVSTQNIIANNSKLPFYIQNSCFIIILYYYSIIYI